MRHLLTAPLNKLALCLVFLYGLLVVLGMIKSPTHSPLVLTEAQFTDPSPAGMKIVPASCASSPNYYHGSLNATTDNLGYILTPGVSEFGGYARDTSAYFCVSNSSGNTYFIPAKTQSEVNSFKVAPPPGVQAW